MASFLSTLPEALKAPGIGEALSGIFGSVSLTAWICLLLPQLITNYKSKSADALSMKFLFIWLLGDISNLSGALWTSLAPSTVALACYFCVADLILIAQCSYYNTLNARRRAREHRHARRRSRRHHSADSATTAVCDDLAPTHDGAGDSSAIHDDTAAGERPTPTEDTPLIVPKHRRRSDSTGLPGSHRRHSTRRQSSNLDPLTRIITGEDDTPDSNPWLHNAVSVLAVWIVGAAGWFVSYKMGAWDSPDSTPADRGEISAEPQAVIGMVLGYISALCYLCARIPQIIKNYQEKSCEGLALLFFLLSLTGNFTYGASVIAYKQERDYIVRALPWLLGSLGTIVEDGIIFVQFRIYSQGKQQRTAGLGGAA
ncbi:PQ loop repeat-domain-containing protein [Podospora australis]|uniref:PQ loop repeat-domain-containing protein n=1 Tax=Podospora australis TaxID=1536484 RepID=A0AAN6X390_9PEZI|nr:PQ loop repeat-domain-containing protein [Podospora australis]